MERSLSLATLLASKTRPLERLPFLATPPATTQPRAFERLLKTPRASETLQAEGKLCLTIPSVATTRPQVMMRSLTILRATSARPLACKRLLAIPPVAGTRSPAHGQFLAAIQRSK